MSVQSPNVAVKLWHPSSQDCVLEESGQMGGRRGEQTQHILWGGACGYSRDGEIASGFSRKGRGIREGNKGHEKQKVRKTRNSSFGNQDKDV